MITSSTTQLLLFISAVSHFALHASASDPDPLQDFCVAANNTEPTVFVNGRICKDPKLVTADDFYFSGGLNKPKPITSPLGISFTIVSVDQLLGLNTQGLSHSRLDYDPEGLDPPHTHPRSSETILLLEGEVYAAFITTDNKLFAKILYAGDMFVFPRGLIHFQYNIGKRHAAAFVSFNSQNEGVQIVANALFGSKPPILVEALAKAFQIDVEEAVELQSRSWPV